MTSYVKKLEAIGIHGRFDMEIDLKPGVNIVFGINGTGKTTFLHILANALNGEFSRFAYITFDSIKIRLDDATILLKQQIKNNAKVVVVKRGNKIIQEIPIRLIKKSERFYNKDQERLLTTRERVRLLQDDLSSEEIQLLMDGSDRFSTEPILSSAYFPAFRTMIDAWVSSQERRERRISPERWTNLATKSAREWFGMFVPSVNYPSLLEIEQRLTDEIQQARFIISRADREYLSDAFLQIFESLSERKKQNLERETILREIKELFDRLENSPLQEESTLVTKVYSKLRESIYDPDFTHEEERTATRVLDVYRDLLRRIVDVQEKSFVDIQRYLQSVNGFLENKKLIVDPSVPRFRSGVVGIRFNDGTSTRGLRVLSSGERQIVTMIYAATHMSAQQLVLIDEPEISLHIDWQRDLLSKMASQFSGQQIIACTHSPVIGAEYEDRQTELNLKPTENIKSDKEFDNGEEMFG